jgi:hypothetical protein
VIRIERLGGRNRRPIGELAGAARQRASGGSRADRSSYMNDVHPLLPERSQQSLDSGRKWPRAVVRVAQRGVVVGLLRGLFGIDGAAETSFDYFFSNGVL